jgi:hypothetical protein
LSALSEKSVSLRAEREASNRRFLTARLNAAGDLVLEGQDLGPATPDGDEYEWFRTVRAAHLPALLAALGESPEADLLAVLEARWSGVRSYDLERLLREGKVPSEVVVI